jgi:hypothetical protein
VRHKSKGHWPNASSLDTLSPTSRIAVAILTSDQHNVAARAAETAIECHGDHRITESYCGERLKTAELRTMHGRLAVPAQQNGDVFPID